MNKLERSNKGLNLAMRVGRSVWYGGVGGGVSVLSRMYGVIGEVGSGKRGKVVEEGPGESLRGYGIGGSSGGFSVIDCAVLNNLLKRFGDRYKISSMIKISFDNNPCARGINKYSRSCWGVVSCWVLSVSALSMKWELASMKLSQLESLKASRYDGLVSLLFAVGVRGGTGISSSGACAGCGLWNSRRPPMY